MSPNVGALKKCNTIRGSPPLNSTTILNYFGVELESIQTPLLRHVLYATLLEVAHGTLGAAGKVWRTLVCPIRTASREDDLGSLHSRVEGMSHPQIRGSVSLSHCHQMRDFLWNILAFLLSANWASESLLLLRHIQSSAARFKTAELPFKQSSF